MDAWLKDRIDLTWKDLPCIENPIFAKQYLIDVFSEAPSKNIWNLNEIIEQVTVGIYHGVRKRALNFIL